MVHVAPPGGWTYEPIHPDKWADQMLKAWKVAAHKGSLQKRNISLTDIDTACPDELVNTPRSLQACLLLGIDPEEIQFRDFDYFTERGLSKEFQGMKFAYFEKERKRKVERLLQERNIIIAEKDDVEAFMGGGKSVKSDGSGGEEANGKMSDSAAKAIKKAEAAAKRAQKDRERKKAAEEANKRMIEDAKRVAALQLKKEAEQAATKRAKEKEFQAQQAAIAEKRRAEEEELEKAATALATKQYAQEIKLAEERKIAAKKAKKAAIAAAKEKAKKQAAFQKELEIMQEKVIQAQIDKTKELEAKDEERKKKKAIKEEEIKRTNAILRAEAERRQAAALQAFYDALKKKRDDFDAKTAAHAARAAILHVEIDKQIKEKIMMQERGEQDRKRTLERAYAIREARCQDILKKANNKAELLKEYMIQKEQERSKRNIQTNLEYTKAMFIVNQTMRKQALHRRQLFTHIEKATERIRDLMETRNKIQKARQLAEAQAMWAQGRE